MIQTLLHYDFVKLLLKEKLKENLLWKNWKFYLQDLFRKYIY